MKILGIETSCDETAAAVVRDGREILSNVIASQVDIHSRYGGIVPEVEPSQRFPVKFYLVAMLFVIFDIEIIFLFAWAVRFRELGWFGLAAVGIFTALVIETLGYVWKRGALDWNIPRRARYRLSHDVVDEEAA